VVLAPEGDEDVLDGVVEPEGSHHAQFRPSELTAEQVRAAAETDPATREAATRLGRVPVIRTAKARSVLGRRSRPVEETVADTARSLLTARTG
jgi:dihydroflavonol-4-reductase